MHSEPSLLACGRVTFAMERERCSEALGRQNDLPPQEAAKVKSMPGSLDEALHALEEDHAFLLKGDVFTRDVIETWIAYKREKELDAIRLRPHPHEFALYFDI